MTVETIFRANFYQNGVFEFVVKHIEDCTSGQTSVWSKTGLFDTPKCFLNYIMLLCDIIYNIFWTTSAHSTVPVKEQKIKHHLSVRLGIERLMPVRAVTITHVNHCLLLVQPMKKGNRPGTTENLLTRT